jgi:tRNA A37 threonylcarbamoyladenosine modification protein TsaB
MKKPVFFVSSANDFTFAAIFYNNVFDIEYCQQNVSCESLMLIFNHLLEKYNLRLSDISDLFLNIGPGGFTAVRIAISFISPIWQIHNFNLIALPASYFFLSSDLFLKNDKIAVLIKGKKYDGFVQIFDKNLNEKTEILAINCDEVESFCKQNKVKNIITNCDIKLSDTLEIVNYNFDYLMLKNLPFLIENFNFLKSKFLLKEKIIDAIYCKEADALTLKERGLA